jgi:hypothetical protein
MTGARARTVFEARLMRPADPADGTFAAFVVLPRPVSEALPRRGRTSVDGTLDGHAFRATLEPDGQLSHWLPIGAELLEVAGATIGDLVAIAIEPVRQEPEPTLPADLAEALDASPEARAVWDATTTVARVDWIHWITSAKQDRTRRKRIADACDMLASGKRRVCCFDPSGYYSKGFRAPEAMDWRP